MSGFLLLRSGGGDDGGGAVPSGVEVLVTHEVTEDAGGIAETLAVDPVGTRLVVTSKTTVRVLASCPGAKGFFTRPFASVLAAGAETAGSLRAAGSVLVLAPDAPGATGLVPALLTLPAPLKVLWPHGSDADPVPFRPVKSRAVAFDAPVVYLKRALPLPAALLERVASGAFSGIAVSSLAALDVLMQGLSAAGLPVPHVTWAAVGPATARAFAARGLPPPIVPKRPRVADLLAILMEKRVS